MKRRTWYIIGFALIIGICASAFIITPNGSFGGSDDQGSQKILQIDPNYVIWFKSIWNPPPETQSLLFAVQAAIGASIIGFFIGNERGKRVTLEKSEKLKAVQTKATKNETEGKKTEDL
jgi:cobalt/nickel transport protein